MGGVCASMFKTVYVLNVCAALLLNMVSQVWNLGLMSYLAGVCTILRTRILLFCEVEGSSEVRRSHKYKNVVNTLTPRMEIWTDLIFST